VIAGVDAHGRCDRAEFADLGVDDVAVVDDVAEGAEGRSVSWLRGPTAVQGPSRLARTLAEEWIEGCSPSGGWGGSPAAGWSSMKVRSLTMPPSSNPLLRSATLGQPPAEAIGADAPGHGRATLLALSGRAICHGNVDCRRDDRRIARSLL
jgi:hypothetical protein